MMIPIGYESTVESTKVVGTKPSNGSWAKREIKKAEEGGTLFYATAGRKARSIVVTAQERVVIVWVSALQSSTLAARVDRANRACIQDEEED